MNVKRVCTVVLLVLGVVASLLPRAQADSSEHALPEKNNLPAAIVEYNLNQGGMPSGANIPCQSSEDNPPIILLHGMNSSAYTSFAHLSPELARHGHCVYAFDFGKVGTDQFLAAGKIPGFFGLVSLSESYPEVENQIDRILHETGSSRATVIGYSLGGLLATKYAKDHSNNIDKVITIAGLNHGTSVMGLSNLHDLMVKNNIDINPMLDELFGPVTKEILEDSALVRNLADGGITAEGVEYVSISTRADTAATPLSNSQFDSPDAKNYVIQDECPLDFSDHLGIMYSPETARLVLNSLGESIPAQCGINAGPFMQGSSV